ncbi:MAG: hypothetical protein ACK4GO_02850 [Gemmobacter sp.]
MNTEIVAFRPKERVRQDSEPIALMYRNMGTAAAEEVVTRALAELAMTMAGLADLVRSSDRQDLARQLRRLQRMAEQLGMVSMGQVAADIRICLDQGDSTAFAAVWARLLRVAEGSLSADKGWLDQRP